MKREGGGEGYKVMKKGHEEKSMASTSVSDLKYSRSEMGNPQELSESVNKLSGYVKKNKMKY